MKDHTKRRAIAFGIQISNKVRNKEDYLKIKKNLNVIIEFFNASIFHRLFIHKDLTFHICNQHTEKMNPHIKISIFFYFGGKCNVLFLKLHILMKQVVGCLPLNFIYFIF
jgi:hypothetical protein